MSNLDTIRTYVEEVMLILEQMGVPRTASRILAYLLVCDPPEQSIQDFVEALKLSKSSVSTALHTLSQYHLIDRVSLPGKRADFYRVSTRLWHNLIQSRTDQMTALRETAEEGLELLTGAPERQKNRLKAMHSLFAFMEKEMPGLLRQWEETYEDAK